MIVKQILRHETQAGVLLTATSGCAGCQAGCGVGCNPFGLTGQSEASDIGQLVSVAVNGWRLHAVALVVFGLPLILLVGTVIGLEVAGLSAQPLSSLFLLMVILAVAVKVIVSQGANLLDLLQARQLSGSVLATGQNAQHESNNNIRNNTA